MFCSPSHLLALVYFLSSVPLLQWPLNFRGGDVSDLFPAGTQPSKTPEHSHNSSAFPWLQWVPTTPVRSHESSVFPRLQCIPTAPVRSHGSSAFLQLQRVPTTPVRYHVCPHWHRVRHFLHSSCVQCRKMPSCPLRSHCGSSVSVLSGNQCISLMVQFAAVRSHPRRRRWCGGLNTAVTFRLLCHLLDSICSCLFQLLNEVLRQLMGHIRFLCSCSYK